MANHAHNPVPFDFVPFSKEKQLVSTVSEWEGLGQGKLLSGCIKYKLHIKTPLHIVGNQKKNTKQEIEKSNFMRRNGSPVILSTSLKGMIRAFMEALTDSWISQATDCYEMVHGERSNAFSAFSSGAKGSIGPAIPLKHHPNPVSGKIDLATFLFGSVFESNEDSAYPSRLFFEDVNIQEADLLENSLKFPDIPGKAFMGGPKPRINNWWYFEPKALKKKVFKGHQNTDFIGGNFRGRKFYYHQNPKKVLAWYANPENWPHMNKKKETIYREYPIETLPENKSLDGKIYFEYLPSTLLGLVLLSITPKGMAHKLGYGQAFGLGSIQFEIINIYLTENEGFDTTSYESKMDPMDLTHPCYKQFVDPIALKWLRRILTYDSNEIRKPDHIFTYPLFGPTFNGEKEGDFQKLVSWTNAQYAAKLVGAKSGGNTIALTDDQANKVAETLWDKKKAIHFRLYQEKSCLWPSIAKRA